MKRHYKPILTKSVAYKKDDVVKHHPITPKRITQEKSLLSETVNVVEF